MKSQLIRISVIGAFLAMLSIAIAAYFASPYLAIASLAGAVKAGDRDRLEQLIDFPSVRENLKADLNAKIMDKLQNDPEMRDNPFVGLGMAMVPMMVDKMIDAYFTPAQIAAQRQESPLYIKSKAEQPAANKARMNYKTLDSFYVSYDTGINSDMTLVLKRHGLYEWQVKRVELPDNFMDSKNP